MLGEAILGVVNGIDAADFGTAPIVAAVAGFVIAASVWWAYFDQFDEDVIDRALAKGSAAQVRSFLYGYGHLLLYAAIVAIGVGVELSIEEAASGGTGVPLLGLGVAGVVGGLLLTSSDIGRSARPVVLGAKFALVTITVAAALASLCADVVIAAAAACWVGLIALEARPSRTGSPQR